MKQQLMREGDINTSIEREVWNRELNCTSKVMIDDDTSVFMRQSMSTPCLTGIANAEGCYFTDVTGKKYLDFHGNSVHQVGHKNTMVVEAIKDQLDDLSFIPRRFTADVTIQAAKALVEKTTSRDYKVLFTPSGSAAVGLALKIARKVTGRHKVISLWESFHGAGLDTISAGGEYVFKKDMGPSLPGMIKSIPYNGYRNLLHSDCPEKVATFCLEYLEYIISHEGEIGAILLEPVRATDTHIPPVSYFKRLRELCDRHGIVLIFDEIPTAFMRSGEFYVHQHFGIEPDILVLGKGIGGGIIPQAAVLARTKYDCGEDISLGHYTHEKPALGSAAILATIRYIDEQRLGEQCKQHSLYVRNELEDVAKRYDVIGDIRVLGLLISIELVKDYETKEKNDELAEKVLYHCLKNGLSFKVSNGNCITWHPPLIVTQDELQWAIHLFEEALQQFVE